MKHTLAIALCLLTMSTWAQETLDRPWELMLQDPNVSYQDFVETFERQTKGLRPSQINQYKKFILRSQQQHFLNKAGELVLDEHINHLLRNRHQLERARSADEGWYSIEPETDLLVKCCLWDGCGVPDIPQNEIMNVRNRLLELAIHPEEPSQMWLSSPAGGLWKSTDAGETWLEKSTTWRDGGCRKIVLHPTDPNTVYVGTGGDGGLFSAYGVQKTTDGGETWTLLNGNRTDIDRIYQLQMDPKDPTRLFMGTERGLFTTDDAGENWTEVGPLKGITCQDFILVEKNDSVTIHALTQERSNRILMFSSVDYGITWDSIDLPYLVSQETADDLIDGRLAFSPADPEIVYLVGWPTSSGTKLHYNYGPSNENKNYHHLYKSHDGGATFLRMPDQPELFAAIGTTWGTYQFEVNPEDANDIAFGSICTGFSKDGGETWEQFTWHQVDKQHFSWHPTTNELYCVDDGGIVKLTKAGEIVEVKDPQLIQYYDLTHASDLSYFGGGTQDAGTMVVIDGMRHRIGGGDGMSMISDPVNSNLAFTTSQNGFFKKVFLDRPKSGNAVLGSWMDDDQDGTWVSQIVMHPWNHNKLFAAVRNIFYSEDNGDSWTKLTENDDLGYAPDYLRISESNPNILVAGHMWEGQHRSEDFGRTWMAMPNPFFLVRDIEISPTNPDHLWAAGQLDAGEIGVFESLDAGATWTSISGNLENTVINDLVADKNVEGGVYAMSMAITGIFHRSARTEDWTDYSEGMPSTSSSSGALDIVYQTGKIRVGTHGRGAWERDLLVIDEGLAIAPPMQPLLSIGSCNELMATAGADVDSLHWYVNDELLVSNKEFTMKPDRAGHWSVRVQNKKRLSYASESIAVDESQVGGVSELTGPSSIGTNEVAVFAVPDFDQSAEYRWFVSNSDEFCDGSNSEHFNIATSGTVRLEVTTNCGTQVFEKFVEVIEGDGVGLDFDGVDDFVVIERFDLSQVTDFTVEMHVRMEAFPQDRVALVEFGSDWNDHIAVQIMSDGSMEFVISEWEDGYIGTSVHGSDALELNRWYHLAVSYLDAERTAIVYVDGVEVAREENMVTQPADVRFREAHLGTSFYWVPEEIPYLDGQIDNFRFWQTVRAADDISMNAHCYGHDPEQLPIVDYRFQDGVPGSMNDPIEHIGNQVSELNPGRLMGFELTGTTSNFVSTILPQVLCDVLVLTCEPTTSVPLFSERQFSLVPNPTSGYVRIHQVESEPSGYLVRLYDILGQLVYSGENSREINVSAMSPGTYQVLIRPALGDEWISKKLVVVR